VAKSSALCLTNHYVDRLQVRLLSLVQIAPAGHGGHSYSPRHLGYGNASSKNGPFDITRVAHFYRIGVIRLFSYALGLPILTMVLAGNCTLTLTETLFPMACAFPPKSLRTAVAGIAKV